MNYGKLLGMIAGTGAGLASIPEDAEASMRKNLIDIIKKANTKTDEMGNILPHSKVLKANGERAGTLDSRKALDVLMDPNGSHKYSRNQGYMSNHSATERIEKSGWTPEELEEAHKGIYNSENTVIVPNVLGREPYAKEALWSPDYNGKSYYMPIKPYKGGFQEVTIYSPEASQVERLLRKRGYWDDGASSSPIFVPTLEGQSLRPAVGSRPLSAVSNTLLGEKLVEAMNKGKKVLPPALIATEIPTQTDANIPSGDEYGWPIRRGFTIDEPGIKEAYAPWDIAFDLYGGGAAAKVVNVAASLAAENIPQGLLDVITFYSEQE